MQFIIITITITITIITIIIIIIIKTFCKFRLGRSVTYMVHHASGLRMTLKNCRPTKKLPVDLIVNWVSEGF